MWFFPTSSYSFLIYLPFPPICSHYFYSFPFMLSSICSTTLTLLSNNLTIHLFPLCFSSHKRSAVFIFSLSPPRHPSCCRLPDSGDSGGQTGSGHLDSPPHNPSQSFFDLLCEFFCVCDCKHSYKRAAHEDWSVGGVVSHAKSSSEQVTGSANNSPLLLSIFF